MSHCLCCGGKQMLNEMSWNSRYWMTEDGIEFAHRWTNEADEMADEITDEINESVEEFTEDMEELSEFDADDWDADDWDEDDWDDIHDRERQDKNIHGSSQPSGDYTDTGIAAEDIKDMEIAIGGAALYLKQSENNNFGVQIDGIGDYTYRQSGKTFRLESDKHNVVKNNNEKVYLYLPKNAVLDDVDISVGGGLVELGEIAANSLDLEAGAGMIVSEKIQCKELSVDIGAGKATLKGVETKDLDINVGVGHAYVAGDVSGEIDAECGMGVLELVLAGAEEDFNYELSCAAGGISIDGETISVLADDKDINNGAGKECNLDCAMGSIKVTFK